MSREEKVKESQNLKAKDAAGELNQELKKEGLNNQPNDSQQKEKVKENKVSKGTFRFINKLKK